MVDRFLKRGFTDKQAKLKVIWENPNIASICSQMPNLTILSANVAAARDQTKLARAEFDSFRRYALETKADYCAGCGKICREAVGGAVPVNEVMRCLMYQRYYGEPELARLTFAGLGEEVKQRLTEVDYSRADRPARRPGHRRPYAPGEGDAGLALSTEVLRGEAIFQRPPEVSAASEGGIRRSKSRRPFIPGGVRTGITGTVILS